MRLLKAFAAASLTAAAFVFAPSAHAITCEALDAQIAAHNNAMPSDYASDGEIAAYNAEADRLNSTPCV